MRCRKCGTEIKEGSLYCEICGEEVRIVPDYSSLDELLAEHVRNELYSNIQQYDKKIAIKSKRKQKNCHKKMRIILSSLFFVILVGLLLYQISYAGYIKKGYNALKKENYDTAIQHFESAIKKDDKKAGGYKGIADVYLAKNAFYSAEEVFLKEIERQKNNEELYKSLIQIYIDAKKKDRIPILLANCKSESVLSTLSDYAVEKPSFSLKRDFYNKKEELELYSKGNDIYYTLDGSEPSKTTGAKYNKDLPILLDEGNWIVRAVAVNKKGIPSLLSKHTYKIQTPLTEAPIVSPSSGLYEQQEKITVEVKDGYTAYYAFGTTEPTEENWKKYIGPIPMPQGNLIFSAILVENSTGKTSAVTVRNYDLEMDIVEDENIQEYIQN
ncbi:chitobiase/beta-hexosaminidase C-terminal domain-containing protein [Faecalimonas sp.]